MQPSECYVNSGELKVLVLWGDVQSSSHQESIRLGRVENTQGCRVVKFCLEVQSGRIISRLFPSKYLVSLQSVWHEDVPKISNNVLMTTGFTICVEQRECLCVFAALTCNGCLGTSWPSFRFSLGSDDVKHLNLGPRKVHRDSLKSLLIPYQHCTAETSGPQGLGVHHPWGAHRSHKSYSLASAFSQLVIEASLGFLRFWELHQLNELEKQDLRQKLVDRRCLFLIFNRAWASTA